MASSRYKISAGDDETYDFVITYLAKHEPGHVKVRVPNRRLVSAENLGDRTIEALKEAGARVAEEYQFSYERAG